MAFAMLASGSDSQRIWTKAMRIGSALSGIRVISVTPSLALRAGGRNSDHGYYKECGITGSGATIQGGQPMTEGFQPTPEQLIRQTRQHLESLRAAGVEWLPAAPAVRHTTVSSPPATSALNAAPSFFNQEAELASASQTPVLDPAAKRRELQVLEEQVSGCTRCPELCSTRTQTVFGVGSPDAELCFLGEAPGADEDAQGEPFVGAAGQLLNRIIAACGMKREDVYICNILRCRPPGNRTPLPNEAANCRGHLDSTLELIRPKFICCL